jgi:hypothetical protein
MEDLVTREPLIARFPERHLAWHLRRESGCSSSCTTITPCAPRRAQASLAVYLRTRLPAACLNSSSASLCNKNPCATASAAAFLTAATYPA